MSQALATRDAEVTALANDIRGEKTLAQIQSVLPDNVPVSRFVRAAITAVTENPDLVDVDRNSLFLGLVKCAQDGLLPDGREAALIPFNDRKRGRIATYIPMIGGFRKIAGEHGWSIETAVVREKDVFEFERGSEPRVIHRQPKLGVERGAMVGAYAIGRHRSMPTQIVVLDAGEVEKIKATSRALNFGPWKDWEPQMWEKTAGRKLFKQLPLGERETERIRRMLAESDITDPAAAMYGAGHTELPPADAAPAEPPPSSGDLPQQAAPLPTPGGAAPADEPEFDGPEPGADPGPQPEPEPPAGPVVTEAALAAGETVFQSGKYAGRRIRDIAEDGDDGLSYLAWAAKSWKSPDFARALHDFLAGYAPERLDS
jgi:phage RecT family recombinase